MADKRISQLVERINIANNDVLPIVSSGATTTNKVTISTIQDWMQDNLDVGVTSIGITLGTTGTNINVTGSPVTSSGNITINIPTASATNRGALSSADWSTFNSKVSSVGLSMPSAFSVANSPITSSGTIAVTGAGTVSQYIRGDGSLADFPQGGGGGGASVNYYLNGSVSQGTIGGIAYREINKTPILGAGTDFVAIADGYLASFITDAGDPALLEIPAGNWNFETYFSASSGGGSPTFYIELYKVDSGGTATLIASNSATPELIAFGTTITPYFSTLSVPTTSLTLTDRLALRYYVARSGRTITLHTENSHLCQIITTFTTGLTALNGLTAQVQNFATGTSGTDFNISSATNIHTFNIPTASATNRGLLSSADWTTFNNKAPSVAGGYVPYTGAAANVDLGVYNVTASAVNVNGSGSNAGVINLESNAIFPLVNGYGTIGSGTTNQFNFYQTTGAGVFRGAILSLNGITASATRTYTLPDADGTLALTSQIPTNPVGGTGAQGRVAYWDSTGTITSDSLFQWNDTFNRLGIGRTPTVSLDVEGAGFFSGALGVGGALNGTSASFSSTITSTITNGLVLSNNTSTTQYVYTSLANSVGNARYGVDNSSGGGLGTGTSANSAVFGNAGNADVDITTNNISRLKIASTGAATFSSSVGINGVAPSYPLYVRTGTNQRARFVDNGGLFQFGVLNDAESAYSDLSLGNSAVVIKAAGNVGIGTAANTTGFSRLVLNGNSSGSESGIQVNYNGSTFGGFALTTLSAAGGGMSLYTYTGNVGSESYTERMRITSGGNIGINNNNPGSKIDLNQQTSDWSIITRMTAASGLQVLGYLATISNQAPNNTSSYLFYGEDNVTARFTVRSNGGISNFQANDVNLSDERTKKDIEPLESYWNKFKAIQIVKFKYKDQTHDDFNIGVIAQQVESVAPEFVDVDGWGKPQLDEEGNEIVSDEEPLKSIYTADLHHATIKVLQEAMAKIEKLEIEISSLKNQIK